MPWPLEQVRPRGPAAAPRIWPWLAALLTLPGWSSPGTGRLCIVSRHSGEVIAGEDFALEGSSEAGRAVDLAEIVRLEGFAGRAAGRSGPDFQLEVDEDRILVRHAATPPPRSRADSPVEVQVFGLVGSERVRIRCPGRAVRVETGRVEDLSPGWQTLRTALGSGAILCAGGPWSVRVAGSRARPYAGTFSFRPLPDRPPEAGTTPREARARRGSEVVFRTTLASYVAGVLAAEQAELTGEAAVALAQVIAHDARVERHPGRPLCDTTHCQAFLGTAVPTAEARRALELPELPTNRWLPYFRGGEEPWEVRRSSAEVRAVLGDAVRFGGDGRALEVTRSGGVARLACEPVRAALRLPSCPTDGVFQGETVRIRGRGRGHGLGLDVEAARRSVWLTAPELLRRAYGFWPTDSERP